MLTAQSIITRVYETLDQTPSAGEDLSTRAQARPHRGRRSQMFSTEDLLIRLHAAETEVVRRAEAMYAPDAIFVYTGTLDPIGPEVMRILPNRIFRNGIRCVVVEPDNNAVRLPARYATSEKPVASIGADIARVYPDASNVMLYAMRAPNVITLAEYQAGDVSLLAGPACEEAIVQHVCESCRLTQLAAGDEIEMLTALAKYHRRLFDEEISLLSPAFRPQSKIPESNVSTEFRSR